MNAADLRLPPHSVESEQSVLGGLLLQNDALDRIIDLVGEQDFYHADHRAIWRQTVALIDAGKPADVITVAEALDSRHLLEDIGGLPYLAAMAQNIPSAANIRHYAEIVREKATKRALSTVGDALLAAIHDPDGRTSSEIASEAISALEVVTEPLHRGDVGPTTLDKIVGQILRNADDPSRHQGIDTGISDWDVMSGGLRPGQLIIPAARPSVGKSAFVQAVTRHVAEHHGHVAVFALEMEKLDDGERHVAALASLPIRSLHDGPSPVEWERLSQTATLPWLRRVHIDDRPAVSLAYIRASCRLIKRAHGLALVVIDYLQLMTGPDPRAPRHEQVAAISRGLKALAKELHVPVISLSQLNRASLDRSDKRPTVADLRESGQLEQDADQILLLHPFGDGVLEVSLAKHRQGPTGFFWLDFDQPTMTFRQRYGAPPEPEKPKQARGFVE